MIREAATSQLEESGGNVFADLGLDDPDAEMAAAERRLAQQRETNDVAVVVATLAHALRRALSPPPPTRAERIIGGMAYRAGHAAGTVWVQLTGIRQRLARGWGWVAWAGERARAGFSDRVGNDDAA